MLIWLNNYITLMSLHCVDAVGLFTICHANILSCHTTIIILHLTTVLSIHYVTLMQICFTNVITLGYTMPTQ